MSPLRATQWFLKMRRQLGPSRFKGIALQLYSRTSLQVGENLVVQRISSMYCKALQSIMALFSDGLVPLALNYALTNLEHVMVPTQQRLLSSFFAMMNYSIRNVITHDSNQGDFPLSVRSVAFQRLNSKGRLVLS